MCPYFAMYYFASFYFCNHLATEVRAGCLTLILFLHFSGFGALCLFLTVLWVGLQWGVIVVFLFLTVSVLG